MTFARFSLVTGMVLVAVLAKFLPHPQNFAPIGAIALFAGAHFQNRKWAFLMPLASLFLGDLTGLHTLMPFVYGCFLLNVLLGIWIQKQQSLDRILAATFMGSVFFYLVTNFGVWTMLETYPHTSAGLLACYTAGLPFFANTLLGDLFYTAVLFGGMAFAEWRFPAVRQAKFQLL
jgi:hypothetical protein